MKALSDAEKEKLFAAELALWEKIKESKQSAPLEDYLRRYPSGEFAELAQLQLDRVLAAQGEKRVEAAAAAGNPYTQGSARANIGFRVGDVYNYRLIDSLKNTEEPSNTRVTEIRENEVAFSGGLITDLLGNIVRRGGSTQTRYTPRQDFPLEYAVGRRWTTRTVATGATGVSTTLDFEFRITRREKITVPAGTFDCYVIEGIAAGLTEKGVRTQTRSVRWMAPDRVRRPIAQETVIKFFIDRKPPPGVSSRKPPPDLPPIERVTESTRIELVEFRQS